MNVDKVGKETNYFPIFNDVVQCDWHSIVLAKLLEMKFRRIQCSKNKTINKTIQFCYVPPVDVWSKCWFWIISSWTTVFQLTISLNWWNQRSWYFAPLFTINNKCSRWCVCMCEINYTSENTNTEINWWCWTRVQDWMILRCARLMPWDVYWVINTKESIQTNWVEI